MIMMAIGGHVVLIRGLLQDLCSLLHRCVTVQSCTVAYQKPMVFFTLMLISTVCTTTQPCRPLIITTVFIKGTHVNAVTSADQGTANGAREKRPVREEAPLVRPRRIDPSRG